MKQESRDLDFKLSVNRVLKKSAGEPTNSIAMRLSNQRGDVLTATIIDDPDDVYQLTWPLDIAFRDEPSFDPRFPRPGIRIQKREGLFERGEVVLIRFKVTGRFMRFPKIGWEATSDVREKFVDEKAPGHAFFRRLEGLRARDRTIDVMRKNLNRRSYETRRLIRSAEFFRAMELGTSKPLLFEVKNDSDDERLRVAVDAYLRQVGLDRDDAITRYDNITKVESLLVKRIRLRALEKEVPRITLDEKEKVNFFIELFKRLADDHLDRTRKIGYLRNFDHAFFSFARGRLAVEGKIEVGEAEPNSELYLAFTELFLAAAEEGDSYRENHIHILRTLVASTAMVVLIYGPFGSYSTNVFKKNGSITQASASRMQKMYKLLPWCELIDIHRLHSKYFFVDGP